MALYKIQASRVNNIDANEYTGSNVEEGLIWYDPSQGILRLYNGAQGGYIINTGTGGNSTALINGSSNVIVYPSGAVAVSVNGAANVAVFEGPQAQFDNVVSAGNVTATYFHGNGSQLTGLPATYSNAQVASYLSSGTNTSNVTTTGNINAGNVNATHYGNGAGLTSINGSNVTGTVANAGYATTASVASTVSGAAQANITSVGVLTSLSASGNITGSYFIGNGSLLTGLTGTLPPQAGNSGKYLGTNGSSASWQFVPGVFGLVIDGGNAMASSNDFIIDGGGA